jgi:hypothetical protein
LATEELFILHKIVHLDIPKLPKQKTQAMLSMCTLQMSLLFAASATAQVTTSILMYKPQFGTDKIGFLGSVIGVSNSYTTIALAYDNGTDTDALGLYEETQTVTVGPTLWEAATSFHLDEDSTTTTTYPVSDAESYTFRCEIPTAPANAQPACTMSYGGALAQYVECDTDEGSIQQASTSYDTTLYTYSGRGTYSAGVETVTETYIFGPNSNSAPSWCSDESYFPSSGYVSVTSVKREDFASYQVVITAGAEKLSATAKASASVTSPSATGSSATGSKTSASVATASKAAAAPMMTVGPVVVGLGAAFAAFVV